MAVAPILDVSQPPTIQVGDRATFMFWLLDASGGPWCHCSGSDDPDCLLPCPGYSCDYSGCDADGTSKLIQISCIITPPTGEALTISEAYATMHEMSMSPLAVTSAGVWTFQFRFDGQFISEGVVDNTLYSPSEWVTRTVTVIPQQTRYNTTFTGVSITPTSITPGQSITLTGRLTLSLYGTGISDAVLYLQSSPTAGIMPILFYTDISGNFSVTFTPCSSWEYCAGTQWVKVAFDGDAYFNPAASSSLPFTTTGASAYMNCYPTGSSVYTLGSDVGLGFALRDTQSSSYIVGEQVSIIVTNQTTSTIVLQKFVTSPNGWYQENFRPTTKGTYQVVYKWEGDVSYGLTTCVANFTVGECLAPVYQTCPDNSVIMTYDCQNYTLIPTNNECEGAVHHPQIMLDCSATPVDDNDLILPNGVVGLRVILDSGLIYGDGMVIDAVIAVEVLKPGALAWVVVGSGYGSAHVEYYPDVVGDYYVRFTTWSTTYAGIIYDATSCTRPFTVGACLDGQYSGQKICGNNSTIYQYVCQSGQWEDTHQFCPEDSCFEDEYATCCDGSVIKTYECIDNVRYPTHNECPVTANDCTEPLIKTCDLGGFIIEKDCNNGCYIPTNERCPECITDEYIQCSDGSWVISRKCDENGFWDTTYQRQNCPNSMLLFALVGGVAAAGAVGYMAMRKKGKKK